MKRSGAMNATDARSGPFGVGLPTVVAAIALDLRARPSPLLSSPTAAEWPLVALAGPRLDFRDRFRPPPEISNFRLSIFDPSWIQLIESIEETAKIVV